MTNQFHIAVGAAPDGIDLSHQLSLLKAALLYADRVTVYSVASNMLLMMARASQRLSRRDTMKLLQDFMVSTGKSDIYDELIKHYKYFNNLSKKNRLSKEASSKFVQVESLIQDAIKQMKLALGISADQFTGVDGLGAALNSGIVEIYPFKNFTSTDELAKEYFDLTSKAVLDTSVYPLFDDMTGDLIRLSVKEGKLDVNRPLSEKAKHVGLSSTLLHRLPLFDTATVDEIVDIRKELDKPLKRFRSAIQNYSEEIKSEVWDAEFPHDAEKIFIKYVEPAVLEIQETVQQTSALQAFFSKLNVPSLIGAILTTASQLPVLLASAVSYGADAELRRRQEDLVKASAERNRLFFYYRAGKLLEKRD